MTQITVTELIAKLQEDVAAAPAIGRLPVLVNVTVGGTDTFMDACKLGTIIVIPKGESIRAAYRVPINSQDEQETERMLAYFIL